MTPKMKGSIYMTLELQIEILEDEISEMTSLYGEESSIVKGLQEKLEDLENLYDHILDYGYES